MIRKIWQNLTNAPYNITDTDTACDPSQMSQSIDDSASIQTNLTSDDDDDYCVRGYDNESLQERVQAVVEMEFEHKQNAFQGNPGVDQDKMEKKVPRTFYQELVHKTNDNPEPNSFTGSLHPHLIRDGHINDDHNNRKRNRSLEDAENPTIPRKRQRVTAPGPFEEALALIRDESAASSPLPVGCIQCENSRKRSLRQVLTESEEESPIPKKRIKLGPTPRHHLKLYRIKDASPHVSTCCDISVLAQQKQRYVAVYQARLRRIYNAYNLKNTARVEAWVETFAGDIDKLHELYVKVCNKYDLWPCGKYEGYLECDIDARESEVSKHNRAIKPITIPKTMPLPPPPPRAATPVPPVMQPEPITIPDDRSEASSVSTFHSPRKPDSEKSVSLSAAPITDGSSSWGSQPVPEDGGSIFTFSDGVFDTNTNVPSPPPMDTVDEFKFDDPAVVFQIPNEIAMCDANRGNTNDPPSFNMNNMNSDRGSYAPNNMNYNPMNMNGPNFPMNSNAFPSPPPFGNNRNWLSANDNNHTHAPTQSHSNNQNQTSFFTTSSPTKSKQKKKKKKQRRKVFKAKRTL